MKQSRPSARESDQEAADGKVTKHQCHEAYPAAVEPDGGEGQRYQPHVQGENTPDDIQNGEAVIGVALIEMGAMRLQIFSLFTKRRSNVMVASAR